MLSLLFAVLLMGGSVMAQTNMATTITLNPNKSFCVYEDLKKVDNVQFGARYQMKDGTMSVEITSPNSVLYKAASDASNSIAFKPHEDGRYKLCFVNANNSPRTVTFTMIESAEELKTAGDPTQQELRALVDGLKSIKTEQEFLMRREIEHKQSNHVFTNLPLL